MKEHNERLQAFLRLAQEANMKFKNDKTQLAVSKIKYLGYWISEEKIVAICDMQAPTDKAELQRFLGMTNYLSRFLPNMSKQTKALRNLLKKDSHWVWNENQEKCFMNLKNMVCNAPVLAN